MPGTHPRRRHLALTRSPADHLSVPFPTGAKLHLKPIRFQKALSNVDRRRHERRDRQSMTSCGDLFGNRRGFEAWGLPKLLRTDITSTKTDGVGSVVVAGCKMPRGRRRGQVSVITEAEMQKVNLSGCTTSATRSVTGASSKNRRGGGSVR